MKKICILGKLQSKYKAPFNDPSWEIWSMNKHVDEDLIPRVDKWFDIHQEIINSKATITKETFPFEACHELVHGERYCTTAAYLIAYAILQGAEEIALYGMRFTPDHSRRAQELENVRHMIWFCWGKGIKITCPADEEYLLPTYKKTKGKDFDQYD